MEIMLKLAQYLKDFGIEIDDTKIDKFNLYMETLISYNEKVNLTAITDREEIIVKHFLDSILLLKALEIPENASLIDIGTGAGFPAVPVKIMRPDIKVTLLDSLKKRTVFLAELSSLLGQDNEVVHGRAEEFAAVNREKYDFASVRAVAALNVLCEYSLPCVKKGGIFVAMKGPSYKEEIDNCQNALAVLGAKLEGIKEFDLYGNKRAFVLIKKISQTSLKYPRKNALIAKKPL